MNEDISISANLEGLSFKVGQFHFLFLNWDEIEEMKRIAHSVQLKPKAVITYHVEDWRGIRGSSL